MDENEEIEMKESAIRIIQMKEVDAEGLLGKLKEVQEKLGIFANISTSETPPVWAEGLEPRLEHLEKVVSTMEEETKRKKAEERDASNPAAASAAQNLSMDELRLEQNILHKVHEQVSNEVGAIKYVYQSKVETMSRELDRLQTLLKLRPTTKDLSSVQSVVSDLSVSTKTIMSGTSNKIGEIVKESVQAELASMTDRIMKSEASLDTGFNIANRKIDAFNTSLQNFNSGIESANTKTGKRLDEAQHFANNSLHELEEFTKKAMEDRTNMMQTVDNVKSQLKASGVIFTDYRTELAVKLSKLENAVNFSDKRQKNHAEDVESRDAELNSDLLELQDRIGDYNRIYESDLAKQAQVMEDMQMNLDRIDEKQKEHIEFVEDAKNADVIERAKEHGEQLEYIGKKARHHGDDLESCAGKVASVKTIADQISAEMANFPILVDKQQKNVDRVVDEMRANAASMRNLESLFQDTQAHVDELYKLRDEVRAAQDEGEAQGNRVKQVLDQLGRIYSKTEEHDKTIEDVFISLEEGEGRIQSTVEDLKYSLTEMLLTKHAEIEATVDNVKENLEMVVATSGMNMPMNVRGKAPKGPAGGAKLQPMASGSNVSSKNSYTSGGMGSKGRNYAGTQGNPKYVHNAPTAPGTFPSVTSSQSITQDSFQSPIAKMVADQQASLTSVEPQYSPVGTEHLTAVNLGIEFSYNIQFASDLCVSFEEVCIRANKVDLIPPAICEHMVAVSQGMAQLVATSVDSEMLQLVLRGQQGDHLEADDITTLRRIKMDEYIQGVMDKVKFHNPMPGHTRADARETFFIKFNKILDVCMSKYDQLMVIGESRFGRQKIPSCIACDREMVTKTRRKPNFQSSSVLPGGQLEQSMSIGDFSSPQRVKVALKMPQA